MSMIDTKPYFRTFQLCLVVFIVVLWRSHEMRGLETIKALELECNFLRCQYKTWTADCGLRTADWV